MLIPPNWDSWGKIRVLREGFDAEGISTGWSVDIQTALMATEKNGHLDNGGEGEARATSVAGEGLGDAEEGGALAVYEDTIRDPRGDAPPSSTSHKRDDKIDVGSTNSQDFLSGQLDAMEKLRAEEEQSRGDDETLKSPTARQNLDRGGNAFGEEGRRVNEHIGPVQFNMGGIQVDADDMLKRLKVGLSNCAIESKSFGLTFAVWTGARNTPHTRTTSIQCYISRWQVSERSARLFLCRFDEERWFCSQQPKIIAGNGPIALQICHASWFSFAYTPATVYGSILNLARIKSCLGRIYTPHTL